jgi:hypothetical protein
MHARSVQARSGQTMVEFTVVAALAVLTLTGIIAGSFLYFQNESVTNGARAGSRYATLESSLYSSSSGTLTCEGGAPDSIVNQVRKAINIVPVNAAPLCAVSATQLQQYPVDNNKANIVVDALPSLSAPACVTVTVTYKAQPVAVPFTSPITLSAFSSMPFLLTSSSSTSSGTTTSSLACPTSHTPNWTTTSTTTTSTTATTPTPTPNPTPTPTPTSTPTATPTPTPTPTSTTTTTTKTTSTFSWSQGGQWHYICSTDNWNTWYPC